MTPMSNDKTAEEILVQHSPNPKGGYRGSWIINAMHEYSAQQLKEYREKLKWIILAEPTQQPWKVEELIKLIDQTDSTK